MVTRVRIGRLAGVALVVACLLPALAQGQGRGRGSAEPRKAQPRPEVVVRGVVFIGGYYYDPAYGRYPWWPRARYPYRYYPVYDDRAELRVQATPREAAVYVDGYYAGVVDDFDGFFQRLPLTPGGHEVVLYLEGYRTARHHIYLSPGSTFHLRDALERLPPGEPSEPPRVVPAVPPPPAGTYRLPATRPPLGEPPVDRPAPPPVEGYGTLRLCVQPDGAEVRIDGSNWVSSDGRLFVVELTAGRHAVTIQLEGYRRYSGAVDIRNGEVTELNVSLAGHPDAPGMCAGP